MTKVKLLSKDWKVITEVEIPADPFPEIVIRNGVLFYYDDRYGEFIEADVFEVKE